MRGLRGARAEVRVDGWLYDKVNVSVPGANRVGGYVAMGQVSATSIGSWILEESEWSVSEGSSVEEMLVQAAPTGVIDSLSVTMPLMVTAPLELTIRMLTEGTVELSWPVAAGIPELQSNSALDLTDGWDAVTATPQVVGDRYVVTLSPDQNAAFFRLQQ
jgi:hypothetical protein